MRNFSFRQPFEPFVNLIQDCLDLSMLYFDRATLCFLCEQDIGQSGQTGVYVVCHQKQNAELEPV